MSNARKLGALIAKQGENPSLRVGTVVSVQSDNTATVTIGGDTTEISGVKYTSLPIPGQPCWMVVDNRDLFIIGVQHEVGRTLSPKATRSTSQSIPNSNDTAISFDAVDNDAFGAWSSSQAGRLTVPVPGRYMVVGNFAFAGNATGFRLAQIELNGSTVIGSVRVAGQVAGNPTNMNLTAPPTNLVAGDYVRLVVTQTSGGDLNVNSGASFSLVRLGA